MSIIIFNQLCQALYTPSQYSREMRFEQCTTYLQFFNWLSTSIMYRLTISLTRCLILQESSWSKYKKNSDKWKESSLKRWWFVVSSIIHECIKDDPCWVELLTSSCCDIPISCCNNEYPSTLCHNNITLVIWVSVIFESSTLLVAFESNLAIATSNCGNCIVNELAP